MTTTADILHRSSCIARALLGMLALAAALVAIVPATARAELDPVDAAVEAFAVAGTSVGISVSPEEKEFVKAFVGCAVENDPNKTVVDCGKEAAVSFVPEEGRDFVLCMIEGKPLPTCGARALIAQLPEPANEYGKCIVESNPAACGAKVKTSNMSRADRALAECLGRERDPFKCGKTYVRSEKQSAALEGYRKVHGNTSVPIGQVQGPIKNIIDVAIGIKTDDWGKVLSAGGRAVTKAAGRIVLAVVLTPLLASALGPAVDAAIDHRFDFAEGILQAVRRKDAGLIARYVIEAKLSYSAAVTCALMRHDVPVTGDITRTMCNSIGSAIGFIAKAGMDGVNAMLNLFGLDGLVRGFFGLIGDAANEVRRFADGKKNDCLSPDVFYQRNFARCYSRQAHANILGHGTPFAESRNRACRDHYFRCLYRPDVDRICNTFRDRYLADTDDMTRAVNQAVSGFLAKDEFRACGGRMNLTDEFVEQSKLTCRDEVERIIPATGFVDTPDCGPHARPVFGGPADPLYTHVCHTALDARQKSQRECLLAEWKVKKCESNMEKDFLRRCVCPAALPVWNGKRCGPYRRIGRCTIDPVTKRCKSSWPKTAEAFAATGVSNPLAKRCSTSRPFGTYPNCCPRWAPRYFAGRCWKRPKAVITTNTETGKPVLVATSSKATPKPVSLPRRRVCADGSVVYRWQACPKGRKPQSAASAPGILPGGQTPKTKAGSGDGTTIRCPASRPVGTPPYCCRNGQKYIAGKGCARA